MAFTELIPSPAQADLAINVPRGNLHGQKEHIIDIMKYWGKVRRATRGTEDTARFNAAAGLGNQLRALSWRLDFDEMPGFILTDQFSIDYAKKNFEPARRQILGIVALSDLARLLIDKEEGLIPKVGAPGAGAAVHIMLDSYADEGHPFHPRAHVSSADADALFDQPLDDAAETWYVNDAGLIVKRTPLDMSPSMGMHVQVDNYTFEPAQMQTLFPYLPALSS